MIVFRKKILAPKACVKIPDFTKLAVSRLVSVLSVYYFFSHQHAWNVSQKLNKAIEAMKISQYITKLGPLLLFRVLLAKLAFSTSIFQN